MVAGVEFSVGRAEGGGPFWSDLLGVTLEARAEGEGSGWQSRETTPAVGVHARGQGPGDSFSLPYFEVDDMPKALEQVEALGGTLIHPGERWSICKDSEGSPFGLAAT